MSQYVSREGHQGQPEPRAESVAQTAVPGLIVLGYLWRQVHLDEGGGREVKEVESYSHVNPYYRVSID